MTLPSDRPEDSCHRWFYGFLEVCPEIRVSLGQFRLRPIEHMFRPPAYSPKDIQGTALLRHQGGILRRPQIAAAQFSVWSAIEESRSQLNSRSSWSAAACQYREVTTLE